MKGESNWMKGKKHSQESIDKMKLQNKIFSYKNIKTKK
jgi:hypothetical protein